MKYISYAGQWLDSKDLQAVNKALLSEYLTQGPAVARFERAVANYCGAKYAVAVSSGTAALHIACLSAGLKSGDEGITSPITFVASANAMLYCGAKPVFADIDDSTACIDAEEIKNKISGRTRVVIPVHFGGHPCEMDKICSIVKDKGITVIEDACHALGAEFRGLKIGSCHFSDMTVFSFHSVKHITTGEGGMVLTNNKALYQKLLLLRSHGITRNSQFLPRDHSPWYYEMRCLGFNYRLTDIQNALGLSQLKKLPRFLKKRKQIVNFYSREFSRLPGIKLLAEKPNLNSAHHLFIIRFAAAQFKASKETLYLEYKKNGILANVHYIPVYYHPYYKKIGYRKGLCVNAESYFEEALTLPLYPKMTDRDVELVIKTTKKIVNKYFR